MPGPVVITALVLVAGSLICLIIGVSTDHWLVLGLAHSGLWRECNNSICVSTNSKDVANWLNAVRALEIVSITLAFFSCVAFGLYAMQFRGSSLKLAVLWIPFFTFLLSLIGIIIFAVNRQKSLAGSKLKLGWSFYITNIGCIVCLFICCILSVSWNRHRTGTYEPL